MNKLAQYRKFIVALVGAAVTIAHAFSLPYVDEVSAQVVGVFDAFVALGVYGVPNDPS